MEDFDSVSKHLKTDSAKKVFEALKKSEEGQKLWGEMRTHLKSLNERFFNFHF